MTSPTGRAWQAAPFTLLEMLVAVVLMGLVIGVLASSFHAVLSAWRTGETRGELLAEGHGACALLGSDLSRQVAVLDPACRFESSELRILVTPERPGPPTFVAWDLGARTITRRTSAWAVAAPQAPPSTLTGDLAHGSFEYCVNGRWQPSLPPSTGELPTAVRVRFTLGNQEEEVAFSETWACVRTRSPTKPATPGGKEAP